MRMDAHLSSPENPAQGGHDVLEALFAEGGPLARCIEGYAPRPPQTAFARAVEAILGEGGILLAEVATGTGKTLAYLAPLILSGQKGLVSTATRTLQAQILEKDIPLLSRALGRRVSAVALKGRQNYLCLRRFEQFRSRPLFRFAADAERYDLLERWAGATETGDRAELAELPDDFGPWKDVCSTSETCWGSKCGLEAECHVQRVRRAAHRAQVVVVNHHLFFADLSVRATSAGEVLPRYDAVVFDEAHHLETTATEYFGTQASSYRVADLVRSALALPELGKPVRESLDGALASAEALWRALPSSEGRTRLRRGLGGEAKTHLDATVEALSHLLDRLATRQGEDLDVEGVVRRALELRNDLALFGTEPEPGEVRWVETRGRGRFLHAVPVEVGPVLAANLFSRPTPAVLTSATLRVGGSFAYLRTRLGLPESAREVASESPFDHARQGLIYVPEAMPDPNEPSFPECAAGEVRRILEASEGRAFCLFTSHRVLREVAERLGRDLPYRLLVQGQAPREILLRAFQEDVHSVLLGAQSFWEGVDVPGEALSAVIIDKIPFGSPGDPLVEARIERIRARGESPFQTYQLPAAAMVLRQGVGRLLRRSADRGVVSVLDRRLLERAYGRYLLSSLPPFPLTRDPARLTHFFGNSPAS